MSHVSYILKLSEIVDETPCPNCDYTTRAYCNPRGCSKYKRWINKLTSLQEEKVMDNLQFRRMKNMVKNAYPTEVWAEKVDNMKNDQVAAIYFSLKERGAFDKRKKESKRRDIFQLTIEDCFPEIGTIEVKCVKAAGIDAVSANIRRGLEQIVQDFDNQVYNYSIAPEKYAVPDWDYLMSISKEHLPFAFEV